jgi:hypothetical protein
MKRRSRSATYGAHGSEQNGFARTDAEFHQRGRSRNVRGVARISGDRPSTTTPDVLEDWAFVRRGDAEPFGHSQGGLMKLPPREHRYAVAVREASGLWLTLWIRRAPKGEFFVMMPAAIAVGIVTARRPTRPMEKEPRQSSSPELGPRPWRWGRPRGCRKPLTRLAFAVSHLAYRRPLQSTLAARCARNRRNRTMLPIRPPRCPFVHPHIGVNGPPRPFRICLCMIGISPTPPIAAQAAVPHHFLEIPEHRWLSIRAGSTISLSAIGACLSRDVAMMIDPLPLFGRIAREDTTATLPCDNQTARSC